MALDKKSLLKLLNNPGMFNPDDQEESPEVEPENMDDAEKFKLEGTEDDSEDPESMYEMPEDMEDQVGDMASLAPAAEVKKPSIEESYKLSPEIMKLKKQITGQDDASEEDMQEVAQDSQAPMEMRKKALQKIKEKYLGK